MEGIRVLYLGNLNQMIGSDVYNALLTAGITITAAASYSIGLGLPDILAVKNDCLDNLVLREVSRLPLPKNATKKDCSRGYPIQTMHRRY